MTSEIVCPNCVDRWNRLQRQGSPTADSFRMGILNDGSCDRCTYSKASEDTADFDRPNIARAAR